MRLAALLLALAVLARGAAAAPLEPKKAARLLSKRPLVVLDVRTPQEFAAGRIKGAKNLDYLALDFEEKLARLDKDKTYLVHCELGGRGAKAAAIMERLGFRRVYELTGGFKAWRSEGLPVSQ